jgi:hypothetical protein
MEEILIKALARRQVVIHWLALSTVGCSSELTPASSGVIVLLLYHV